MIGYARWSFQDWLVVCIMSVLELTFLGFFMWVLVK